MANEKRVRLNNIFGKLGAQMLAGDGTINFGAVAPAFPTIDATKHAAIIIEPDSANEEIVYLSAYTAGQTTGTVLRAQEGSTAVLHPANATWIHGPTKRDNAAGRLAYAERTSGNLVLSSTTWAGFDAALDLVVPAFSGDIIEAGMTAFYSNEAIDFYGDICTVVAGALLNAFSQQGAVVAGSGGLPFMRALAGGYISVTGSAFYRLVTGDIAAGLVTIRHVYRGGGGGRTVFASTASTNVPLFVWAKNHGPQEA